jgi:hypothetical protein
LVVTRIPGGVAGIRYTPGSGNADVIITGLVEKEYPIEERVIGPLLKAKGIAKIPRLFLLRGSFGALDDLARLAQLYQADSVFVPRSLERSFNDALSLSGLDSTSGISPVYYASEVSASDEPGYYLSSGSLLIRMEAGAFRFIQSGEVNEIHSQSRSGETVIVGGTLKADAAGWSPIRELGLKALICARFAQREGEKSVRQSAGGFEPAGCPIHDLSTQSELVLSPGR